MVELLGHITKDMAKDDLFELGARVFFEITPGYGFKRANKFLKTFKLPIKRVVKEYIKSMDEAGIDICVPLLIDFEKAIPAVNHKDTVIPYYSEIEESQISLISKQIARYPWRIFPFVMFDPRRENSLEICKKAIEEYGYIGIKMYPALGYHPCPDITRSPGSYWKRFLPYTDEIALRLEEFYEYCGTNEIPITTHVDIEGAFRSEKLEKNSWLVNSLIKIMELNKIKEEEVFPFTEMFNWIMPIRKYNLKINFAHLGGNYFHNNKILQNKALKWREQILNLIIFSKELNKNFGRVYSDLSFHYMALMENTQSAYFKDLRDILQQDSYKSRILFGTDASLLSHTWKEKNYIAPFLNEDNLSAEMQSLILSENPVKFLFKDARIPDSYVRFLKNNAKPEALIDLPPWIIKKGDEFFIATGEEYPLLSNKV
jgi:predicted TIM-barrel fold metal-dependent hydrolase